MKTILKGTLIGTAVWLLCLAGVPVQAQAQDKEPAPGRAPVAAAQPSEAASPELSKAAEAITRALDRKDPEKAFEYMTEKGEAEYLGTMLMQIAELGQISENGTIELPEGIKSLQKAAAELGLDKVDMPQFGLPGSNEDLDSKIKKAIDFRSRLLACLPETDRRTRAVELVDKLDQAFASPTMLVVGPIEVVGERAEVALLLKLDPKVAAENEGAAAGFADDDSTPVEHLTFLKQDGAWKFDGFNLRRSFTQMAQAMTRGAEPFKSIDNLTIAGKTLDGEVISLADYRDKVVLVDFWGTWCGPCVAGLPELSGLHDEFRAQGFEILGVAADEAETLRDFLDKKPLKWQQIVDTESEIANKYGIEALPTTLLIDRQGKHVATNLHGDSLRKAIQLLLEGKTLESINGSAKDILAAGRQQAANEGKLVFLHFGASWCQPCRVLEKWMAQPEIHTLLSSVFVDVRIDTDLNTGAQELLAELAQSDASETGIPWFAILNATEAKPVITSNVEPIGNIGLPGTPEGQAHFVKMFESTGKFSKEQLELIRSTIEKAIDDISADKSK